MNDIEILNFYKTHTAKETMSEFGIRECQFRKILSENKDFHKNKNMCGYKFYTNGKVNKYIKDGEAIPDGFVKGVVRRKLTDEERQAKVQKYENTMVEMYGVKHYNELPEMREMLRCLATPEEMARRTVLSKQTRKLKYGDENYNNREKTARTCLEKYGVDNVSKVPGITDKIFQSKKRNHTVTTSSPEEKMYQALCETYTKEGVVRQYKCDRYPFRCDFYIPSEDLFIELNAHWSHGGMPYDEFNEECAKKLSKWKERAKTSSAFASAIEVWTEKDIEKLRIAKENHLNYVVYY